MQTRQRTGREDETKAVSRTAGCISFFCHAAYLKGKNKRKEECGIGKRPFRGRFGHEGIPENADKRRRQGTEGMQEMDWRLELQDFPH